LFAQDALPGFVLYLVRHAETIANVTRDYSPENQRTFTEKGLAQIEDMQRQLEGLKFDVILCSPAERSRRTILPYLKATHQVAELWPELEECCWQATRSITSSVPSDPGPEISLQADEECCFRFRDDASRRHYGARTYAQGLRQMEECAAKLRERFAGKPMTVLAVAHTHSGARILEHLLGLEPEGRFHIRNAVLSVIAEQADGSFKLQKLNGVEVSGATPFEPPRSE